MIYPTSKTRTELGWEEEVKFREWYSNMAFKLGLSSDPDEFTDYDYRGFWKSGMDTNIDPSTGKVHFPEQFKSFGEPTEYALSAGKEAEREYKAKYERQRGIQEIKKGGEFLLGTVPSWIRTRPHEAVKGAISAAIKKEPVGEAVARGIKGEEITTGREILETLGVEFASEEFCREHPIQSFFFDLMTFKIPTANLIELITDPVNWALLLSPSIYKGTEKLIAKPYQKYIWRKEIKGLAKTVRGFYDKGMSFAEIRRQPAFHKNVSKPWFRFLKKGAKGTFHEPLFFDSPEVSAPVYDFAFTFPAKFSRETVDALPKFLPLFEVAKSIGLKNLPLAGDKSYIKYWNKLGSEYQDLELNRKSLMQELGKAVGEKPLLEAGVEVPLAKDVVAGKKDQVKIDQNKAIINKMRNTKKMPSDVQKDVYIYNHTGQTITIPKERDNLFMNLLTEHNPEILEFLAMPFSNEELTAKLADVEIKLKEIKPDATKEIEDMEEYVFDQEFPDELGKEDPFGARPLASDFEEEAIEEIERNIEDFPAYKKLFDLEQQKEDMRMELLSREVTPPPPVEPPLPPSEIPKTPEEPEGDPIARFNELIRQAKPLRKEIEKAYTEERIKRIEKVGKFIEKTIDQVGGEEGYKIILSKLKGELVSPEAKPRFEPIKEKLSEEELKSLYLKIWKHPYLDNWEKISVADGFTNLLMGAIPQPKKLALLEEVYGSELIKNILSKRVWGAKATDFMVELANVPRALLATADMSAFLRQGIIEIFAHPVISAKTIGKTFEFAFKPESFERYFKDLPEHRHYSLIRKFKLAITNPAKAGMVEREEAFISRFLQKVPILKIPVQFAERSYVGFLNKLRVDIFSLWADELLAKGFSSIKDKELFNAAADVVNTFTGRGSLGKAGNKIAPQLNTLLFSPRLIAARFNALNPVWYAKQPPEIRKKSLGDFAKFVIAGITTLALVKLSAGDDVNVETDPRSSDFGKIRLGNTRFDIWGGFQQWARVFTQISMGQRKSATTGEIISLNKDEYPFTTRKEVLLRFIEGKLAPVPALVNELASGARTFTGEDMTLQSVAFSKFIPMYIQDITEAYADGNLERAVLTGTLAFFGVGAQTWGEKKREWKPGKALPWETAPAGKGQTCLYHFP